MDDLTNKTGNKLDYYSILRRRKRSVTSFLNEFEITTLEQLENVFNTLEKEYVISEEFRDLAISLLPKKVEKIVNPIVDDENNTLSENSPEIVAEVNLDNVPKIKKRIKKEN